MARIRKSGGVTSTSAGTSRRLLKDQISLMRRSRADGKAQHQGGRRQLRRNRLRSLTRRRRAAPKTVINKPVAKAKATSIKKRKRSGKSHVSGAKRRKAHPQMYNSESTETSSSGSSSDETSDSQSSKFMSKSRKRKRNMKLMDLFNSSGSDDSETDSDSDDQLGIFTEQSTVNISKQMKKKIWNRDFINLAKLYYGKESDNISMLLKKTKANTVTSLRRAPQRQISNILNWCRAFQLYASIYTKKYPKEGSSMFQYMSIVQTLAYKGQNWLLYDQKFRQLRSKRRVPWSRLHVQIHLFQSLSKNQSSKSQQPQRPSTAQSFTANSGQHQGPSTLVQRRIFRRGYCWDYQRHGRCLRQSCSRLHKCSLCSGQNAGSTCTTSQQSLTNSSTNQQSPGGQGGGPTVPANPNKS